jgi:hypothetical protein
MTARRASAELRTGAGEALATSIPRTEAAAASSLRSPADVSHHAPKGELVMTSETLLDVVTNIVAQSDDRVFVIGPLCWCTAGQRIGSCSATE